MTDGNVILGGISFQDHEVPDKISFGGKQSLRVHDIVGGQRVVDAMGPNASDISWSGRFRGSSAVPRAKALDSMRIAGAELSLSWLGVFYTVVIAEFQATTEKFYEVPYSIKCVVTNDPTQGVGGIISSLDSLVGGDLATATGILSSAVPIVSTGLSALSAAVSIAPQLQGASTATLLPVLTAAQSEVNTITSTVAANDPALDASSPDGTDPANIASWLISLAGQATAQSVLSDGGPFVARIATNLALGGT